MQHTYSSLPGMLSLSPYSNCAPGQVIFFLKPSKQHICSGVGINIGSEVSLWDQPLGQTTVGQDVGLAEGGYSLPTIGGALGAPVGDGVGGPMYDGVGAYVGDGVDACVGDGVGA